MDWNGRKKIKKQDRHFDPKRFGRFEHARHQVNSLRARVPGVSSALVFIMANKSKDVTWVKRKQDTTFDQTRHNLQSNRTAINSAAILENSRVVQSMKKTGWARMGRSVANTFPQGNASPVATSQLWFENWNRPIKHSSGKAVHSATASLKLH